MGNDHNQDEIRSESGPKRDDELRRVVIRELGQLTRSEGLTIPRVEHAAPTLRRLAAAHATRRHEAFTSSAAAAVTFVVDGLKALRDYPGIDTSKLGALVAAYGIDSDPQHRKSVDLRRDAYRVKYELETGNLVDKSTLYKYERQIVPVLADVLIAWSAADPQEAERKPPAPEEPMADRRLLAIDTTFIFDERRVVKEVYVMREYMALVDLDTIDVSHVYLSDLRPPDQVLRYEPYLNCNIRNVEPGAMGYLTANFTVPQTARGAKVKFAYKLFVTTGEQCRPIMELNPTSGNVDTWILRVQFHPSNVPLVWAFEGVTDPQIPPSPRDDSDVVPISDLGYLEKVFRNVRRNLSTGVTWRW